MEGLVSGVTSPREQAGDNRSEDALVCIICFVPPTDPVVTSCGHLFCWPCLYRWPHHRAQRKTCPTCRIELREDISITPVYGSPESTEASRTAAAAELGMVIPERPRLPFGSGLGSLEDLNSNSGRFVFRSVALKEIAIWKGYWRRFVTLMEELQGPATGSGEAEEPRRS